MPVCVVSDALRPELIDSMQQNMGSDIIYSAAKLEYIIIITNLSMHDFAADK